MYGIIRQAGGHIWCYSRLGEGTTFRIYLPAVDREAASTGAEDAGTADIGALSGTEAVLLVEDDPEVLKASSQILSRHGYRVFPATNGQEALAVVSSHAARIDVIVTDALLPDMTAPDLVERLHSDVREAPVIYTSGFSEEELERRGVVLDADTTLTKPYRITDLLSRLREALTENGKEAT